MIFIVTLTIAGTIAGGSAAGPAGDNPSGAHRFTFEGLDGRPLALADHAGGPILVVNTASFCGYTDQYEGLQALHERYAPRGLTVVGVPSNDFGGQEPGSADEIRAFCTGIYGVTFPLAGKERVRGPNAHAFYRWARAELGPDNAPRWNFHKYLIAPDGRLVAAFSTRTRPGAAEIRRAIEAILPGAGG